MKLSTRERNIAILAGSVLALLALDYMVVEPFLKSRSDMAIKHQLLETQLSEANQTVLASQAARRRWALYKSSGNLLSSASDTENNLLNAIRRWSQASGLVLVSLRPDRSTNEQGLQEISFQANAQGNLQTVSRFVYEVETAEMPVRIRELQLATRTENKDDLTMQMRISTLQDDTSSRQAGLATNGRSGSTTSNPSN